MFKKPLDEQATKKNLLRGSDQRNIKKRILELYPLLQSQIDEIFPPKQGATCIKFPNRVTLLSVQDRYSFFSVDGQDIWLPTLRILHIYPDMMKRIDVDKGAVAFILKGANIMAAGTLVHQGSIGSEPIPEGTPVAVYASGHENAISVGITKLSTKEMVENGKGVAVESMHYLNDCLWKHSAEANLKA